MDVDRRRFPRLSAQLVVRVVSVQDGPEPTTVETVSRDVSSGGIRAQVNRRLETGSFVGLSIDLPGRDDPAELFGEVIWCEPTVDGAYEVGLRFVSGSEDAEETLRDYLEPLLS